MNNNFSLLKIEDYKSHLFFNESAQSYISSRGLDSNYLINNYHVGSTNDYIVMPVFSKNDPVFITSRTYTNTQPTHRHLNGNIQYFYNHDLVYQSLDELIICESPIDCLSLLSYNIPAISTMGTSGYKKNMKDMFNKVKDILIIFDNDENKSGQKGAYKLAETIYLQTNKIARIGYIYIYNDINEMFIKLNDEDFKEEIETVSIFADEFKPSSLEQKNNEGLVHNEKYPILDIVSQYVDSIDRKNKLHVCCCPFNDHYDIDPSFVIYTETNTFYCYGCGRGGNEITFIKELYPNCTFKDALQILDMEY